MAERFTVKENGAGGFYVLDRVTKREGGTISHVRNAYIAAGRCNNGGGAESAAEWRRFYGFA